MHVGMQHMLRCVDIIIFMASCFYCWIVFIFILGKKECRQDSMEQCFIGHKLNVIYEEKLLDHVYLLACICLHTGSAVMNNVNGLYSANS